jgi:hypothetical protein
LNDVAATAPSPWQKIKSVHLNLAVICWNGFQQFNVLDGGDVVTVCSVVIHPLRDYQNLMAERRTILQATESIPKSY